MRATDLKALLTQALQATEHPEIASVTAKDATKAHPGGSVAVKFTDGSSGTVYFAAADAPGGRRLNAATFQLPEAAL